MADLTELKESLDRWGKDRILPGSFLRAVLANDLFDAVSRADPESLLVIRDVVYHIHWELPGLCHGSREKVLAWEGGKEVAVVTS
jgi:hypothetical protein